MNSKVISVILVALIAFLGGINVYAQNSVSNKQKICRKLEHDIRIKNIIRMDLFRIREVEELYII